MPAQYGLLHTQVIHTPAARANHWPESSETVQYENPGEFVPQKSRIDIAKVTPKNV